MYGTNNTNLNVLWVYLYSENVHEMDTGTGIPILLFTLYSNQHYEVLFPNQVIFLEFKKESPEKSS